MRSCVDQLRSHADADATCASTLTPPSAAAAHALRAAATTDTLASSWLLAAPTRARTRPHSSCTACIASTRTKLGSAPHISLPIKALYVCACAAAVHCTLLRARSGCMRACCRGFALQHWAALLWLQTWRDVALDAADVLDQTRGRCPELAPTASLAHLTLGWLGYFPSCNTVTCFHSIVSRLGREPLGGMPCHSKRINTSTRHKRPQSSQICHEKSKTVPLLPQTQRRVHTNAKAVRRSHQPPPANIREIIGN